MGTRSTQPAAQEGTQASHRQAAEQVRRRLTRRGRAREVLGFRVRLVSPGASTFRRLCKRGGESARRISTYAYSRPLCRDRASGSSCHDISTPPSNATDSNAGCGNSRGFDFCRRFVATAVRRTTSPFELDATPMPLGSTPSPPTSTRSFHGSCFARRPTRPQDRRRAARLGPLRARLSGGDLTGTAGLVPLLSKLLRLRDRSDRALRCDAWRLDGRAPDRAVSSISPRRLRPRSIAIRLSRTLHG